MSEQNGTEAERREWEILGPRLTVFNLIHEFLDPAWTEARIAEAYRISTEQVSTARAYVFANFETVMARHYEIERERTEAAAAQRITYPRPTVFERIEEWKRAKKESPSPDHFPTFVEWVKAAKSSADLVGSR